MHLKLISFLMRMNKDQTPRSIQSEMVIPHIVVSKNGKIAVSGYGVRKVGQDEKPIILLDLEIKSSLLDFEYQISAVLYKTAKKTDKSPDWFGPVDAYITRKDGTYRFSSLADMRISAWTDRASVTSSCSISATEDSLHCIKAEELDALKSLSDLSLTERKESADRTAVATVDEPENRFVLSSSNSSLTADSPEKAYAW